MAGDRYEREVVQIALLAGEEAAVRDKEFVGCQVNGPAVLVAQDSEFRDSGFDGEADAIFWEIPPSRQRVIGAILVERCRFLGCRFTNIGLAGPPEVITAMREGFTA